MTQERDDAVLAGELALRLLSEEEAARLRDRAGRDEGFARQVSLWDQAFAGLRHGEAARTPPPRVKAAIDAAIEGDASVSRPEPARTAPANDNRWKLAAAALGALALVELGLLLVPGEREEVVEAEAPAETADPQRPYVAALVPTDAAPPIVVQLDLPQGLLSVDPTGLEAGDRAVQLWILPAGGGDPVSLGLLAPNRDNLVEVPVVLGDLDTAGGLPSLAISLEPEGGSPESVPTGPVVAVGEVRPLGQQDRAGPDDQDPGEER